jgi:hypothetical protein
MATLLVFVGGIFYGGLPVGVAAIIAGAVLVIGLLVGRPVIELARVILGL